MQLMTKAELRSLNLSSLTLDTSIFYTATW